MTTAIVLYFDEHCPAGPADDPWHCEHWYDGDGCHKCFARAMTHQEMLDAGMEDLPDLSVA
jgi:hypothetical protein